MGIASAFDTVSSHVVLAEIEREGAVVVELHGDIDLESTELLADCLAVGAERGTDVLVDLSDVTLIDCSALAVLVQARQLAERRGRKVCLVAPPRLVRRILTAVGLDTVFLIAGDRRQAHRLLWAAPSVRVVGEAGDRTRSSARPAYRCSL